jgi:hypothetical protein
MEAQTIVGIIITSAILLLALIFLLVRRTVVATPVSFAWQRKVWLEHYIWVKESSKDGYPEGARNRVSTMENARIPMMSTMPLYVTAPRTRITYSYEIQRWCNSRELFAKGDERTNVSWPPYTLDDSTHERIRKTKEKYLAFFQTANHKKYQCKLPESAWTTLDEQSTYRLRITLYGKVCIESKPT